MDWSDKKNNFQKSLHIINPYNIFLFIERFDDFSSIGFCLYSVFRFLIIKFVIFCLFFYVFCRSSHHWNKFFEYKQNQNVFPFYIELATCLCIIYSWYKHISMTTGLCRAVLRVLSVPNQFLIVYGMCECWWCNFLLLDWTHNIYYVSADIQRKKKWM